MMIICMLYMYNFYYNNVDLFSDVSGLLQVSDVHHKKLNLKSRLNS